MVTQKEIAEKIMDKEMGFLHVKRNWKYYWRIFYCILKRNFFSDRKRDWKEKAGTGKK